ncbi:MAG: hypothetical protein ACLFV3_06815 [Phycisphaeraceae bacterium]
MTQAALFPISVVPPQPRRTLEPGAAPVAAAAEHQLPGRDQLIAQIRRRNRSVSLEFLSTFNDQSLETYLERLRDIVGHRGRKSVWVRRGTDPAIITRPLR